MKEAQIYLYGDIFNEQAEYAGDWGVISLSEVMKQVNEVGRDADRLVVHIHSRGGDVNEGFAIHDFLVNTGKEIHTIVEGFCASIATVVFLAGTTRQMTSNSEFMIHNPFGGAMGDAEEMKKYVDLLEEMQEKILDFYVAKTGSGKNNLAQLMKEETWLDANEAKKLGFATEVVETMKAVAYFNPKNKVKMEKELNSIQKTLRTILDKISGKNEEPKNLALTAADGTKLEIESEGTTPQVGDSVRADGENIAEASYLMPEGETIVVKDGKIEEIQEPEASAEDSSEEQKKIEELEAVVAKQAETIKNLNDKITEGQEALKTVNDTLNKISSQIVPGYEVPRKEPVVDRRIEGEEPDSDVQAALERRRQRKEAAAKK